MASRLKARWFGVYTCDVGGRVDSTAREEVARILGAGSGQAVGDFRPSDRLFELVYDELHAIAARLMRGERAGHTLRPTALVHEAYLRLVDVSQTNWQDRAHFLRTAARAMRQILVDHARRRLAEKRGGGLDRVTLDDAIGAQDNPTFEILALDDVLVRLSQLDERMCRVVELRVFAGMNMDEIAHVLFVSRRTAYDDWDVAKRWLSRELADGRV